MTLVIDMKRQRFLQALTTRLNFAKSGWIAKVNSALITRSVALHMDLKRSKIDSWLMANTGQSHALSFIRTYTVSMAQDVSFIMENRASLRV
jgi:hypothetical protein